MAVITSILGTDLITNSRSVINTNFSNLNTEISLKEILSNKQTTMTGNEASNTFYLSAKAIYDWATGLFATISNLALKAPLASPTFTGTVTVPTPTNGTDAANKSYVDTAVTGLLDFK